MFQRDPQRFEYTKNRGIALTVFSILVFVVSISFLTHMMEEDKKRLEQVIQIGNKTFTKAEWNARVKKFNAATAKAGINARVKKEQANAN